MNTFLRFDAGAASYELEKVFAWLNMCGLQVSSKNLVSSEEGMFELNHRFSDKFDNGSRSGNLQLVFHTDKGKVKTLLLNVSGITKTAQN